MRTLTKAAQAAKMIRQDLKKSFPGEKFEVRSQNYDGGNSINVNWLSDLNIDTVSEVVSKYQRGSFNCMEDIYENTNRNDSIPQVDYVFCSVR